MVAPVVAVHVTGVEDMTAPAVTINVWLFVPWGTTTLAGDGNADTLLHIRPTVTPPAGATPFSVTVPVDNCPETTVAGLNESRVTTGGLTVRDPPEAKPLGSVAVMVTEATALTGMVETVKIPLVAFPAILKFAGTVAAVVMLLIRETGRPAGGAGPLSWTVPVEFIPPVTDPGDSVTEVIVAGLTVSVPLALLAPKVAVTVTVVDVATPTVVAVNCAVVLFAMTTTFAGTVTDGSPLERFTVVPPAGAAWLMVTVPMELVPPVTGDGAKLNPVTVVGVLAINTTPTGAAAGGERTKDEPDGGGGNMVPAKLPLTDPGRISVNESPGEAMKPPK